MATEVAIATSVSSEGENGQHSRSDGNSGRRRHAEVNKNDVPHQRTNNKRRRLGNTSVPPSEEPSSHYAIVDRPLEIVPSMLSINREADASRRPKKVIVLLDQARLETVKTRKGDFELLNCDDHKGKV